MKTTSFIKSEISVAELLLKPGGNSVGFDVDIVNLTDRFASFQIDVIAPGKAESNNFRWYSLTPEISSKKPPGDSTHFHIEINDSPVPGFVGTMILTVKIFSVELQQEEREVLRLIVEQGTKIIPVKLELPVKKIQVSPQSLIEIPVRIENISQQSTAVNLNLLGIDKSWLVEGDKRILQLAGKSTVETVFICQIPPPVQVVSGLLEFVIESCQNENVYSQVKGILEILAKGCIEFSYSPLKQIFPNDSDRWRFWKRPRPAQYNINIQNLSNLQEEISWEVEGEGLEKLKLEIIPEKITVGIGEKPELQVLVNKRRHWFGLGQKFQFAVKAVISDRNIEIKRESQLLNLQVKPILPVFLQLGIVGLVLYSAWWSSWLNPSNPYWGHNLSVNFVQFNGLGNKLVSVSDDQKIIKWDINGFTNLLTNPQEATLGFAKKAVRVVDYSPVGNKVVAVGLENGEIQFWLASKDNKKPITTFFNQKDDRVFALKYTIDSRYLFSGHGSGLVAMWGVDLDTANNPTGTPTLLKQKKMDFAISALSLAGKEDRKLVIGGRYNQLMIWDWREDTIKSFSENIQGGQDDYIQSINKSLNNSNFLVVGDNQGYITLWNMQRCLEGNKSCEVIDRWQDGHGGKAVRSVSLSDNGCYLASAGDDGRLVLWPLSSERKRSPRYSQGIVIHSVPKPFNSVDIKSGGKNIYIASGNRDAQVRLDLLPRMPQEKCDIKD